MLDISPEKILVVLVVALIVLGPEKLPKMAHQAGAFLSEMRKLKDRLEAEVHNAIPDLPDLPKAAEIARSPISFLTALGAPGSEVPTVEETGPDPVNGAPPTQRYAAEASLSAGSQPSDPPVALGQAGQVGDSTAMADPAVDPKWPSTPSLPAATSSVQRNGRNHSSQHVLASDAPLGHWPKGPAARAPRSGLGEPLMIPDDPSLN